MIEGMFTPSQKSARTNGMSLDIGEKRIGVAIANLEVRFPRPLTTLDNPESFISDIIKLVVDEEVAFLVVGRPRGLDGQQTAQTDNVQTFGSELSERLRQADMEIPVYWIDEALTSAKAEQELKSRGKPFVKGDIDALAAVYMLEDYFKTGMNGGVNG